MSNLLTTIQGIAVRAVQATNPVTFTFGTVTSDDPLRVRIDNSTLELSGDSLILTANVIEKTVEIDKHTHQYDANTIAHTHAVSVTGTVMTPPITVQSAGTAAKSADIGKETVDTVLAARCIEHGEKREGKADSSKIVITVTRKLKKGDKVIMLRVCSGQEWIIMSRVYEA